MGILNKNITAAVVVARMRSSRFPGKSMADLCGKPALQRLIERIRTIPEINRIVIATTTYPEDNAIEKFATSLGIACFRGSENDVMSRVLGAAESIQADVIVHLTGDCPLLDTEVISQAIQLYQSSQVDYVKNFQFGENINEKLNYPRGIEVEVFSTSVLKKLSSLTDDPWLREHVTEPLYTWSEFTYQTLEAPQALARPDIRICIDTPEDYAVVKKIYEHFLPHENFSTAQVIEFLDQHPEIKSLNQNVKQTKYKAAVIGLGNIGSAYDKNFNINQIQTHSGALQRWSKTQLAAGCDPKIDNLKSFQKQWGVSQLYSEPKLLLEDIQPDILSICTPAETHADILQLALNYPVKAILCEKPFVTDSRQGLKLLASIQKKNVLVAINHWMRYSPLFVNLKNLLQDSSFGQIEKIHYHYCKGVFNSGSHAIDLLRFYFADITHVHANEGFAIDTGDMNINGTLEFANGLKATLSTSDYRTETLTALTVQSDQSRLIVEDRDTLKVALTKKDQKEWIPDNNLPWPIEKGNYMLNAVANLVDALELRDSIRCTVEDGLKAILVIEALQESLKTNQRIQVKSL